MKMKTQGSAADVARSIERRIMWKMANQWENFTGRNDTRYMTYMYPGEQDDKQ